MDPAIRDTIVQLERVGGVFTYSNTDTNAVVGLTFSSDARYRLNDVHLVLIGQLRSLEKVDFNAAGGPSDQGFAFLASLPKLRELNLGGTRISDAGLVPLKRLRKLETLQLWLTEITDGGLKHLEKLPSLKTINLWDAEISDRGLKHFKKMKALSHVYIGRTMPPGHVKRLNPPTETVDRQVSAEGVLQLRAARPRLEIVFWDRNSAPPESTVKRPPRWLPDFADPAPVKPREKQLISDLGTRPKGSDWPSFLGPTTDSKSAETGLLRAGKMPPIKLVWQRAIGEGYGAPAISRGRLFFFDRHRDQARLVCLNSETGKLIWSFETPTVYVDRMGYSNGPRCSPVVDDDRVYILGADGRLVCLSVLDGTELWREDFRKRFGVMQYFFGTGSTPVVEGDLLICMVGGSPDPAEKGGAINLGHLKGNGTGIVAFDKYSGKVRYAITNALASYASPKIVSIGERRWGLAFARGRLIGFEPQAGTVDFEFPWKAKINAAVSAAIPVVVDDKVFISEAYGPGSCLLKVAPGGYGVLWRDDPKARDKVMKAHWNTPIYHEGYLYGCSGRHPGESELRCIHLDSGRVMWRVRAKSLSSLLYVDQHFIVLGEYGDVDVIKAEPRFFSRIGELQLREDPADPNSRPLLNYPAWTAPVISHGLLYLRGVDRLLCVDLIPQEGEGFESIEGE